MNNNLEVLLYTKLIKTTKENESGEILKVDFSKYLARYKDKVFNVVFKKETLKRLENMMYNKKLEMPVLLKLSEDAKHYFTKIETRRKGKNTYHNRVLVILDFVDITQGSFPKGKTLDDVINDLENE